MQIQRAAGAYTRAALCLTTWRQVGSAGGSSVRVCINVSCDEREEKRRADAHSGSTHRPKLCHFAVIVSWHSGQGGFGEKQMGWAGAGGERNAMVARRAPRMASTENEDVREGGQEK